MVLCRKAPPSDSTTVAQKEKCISLNRTVVMGKVTEAQMWLGSLALLHVHEKLSPLML